MKTIKLLGAAAGLAVIAALIADPALAQNTVDMRPMANTALEWVAITLGTVTTALVGFGVRYVAARIGLANSNLEASLVARLDDGIHKAIQFALTTAQNEVAKKGSGLEAVKFDNWFMSVAAGYLNDGFPKIIAQLGLSQERIRQLIAARLQPYLSAVEVAGGAPTPAIVIAGAAPGTVAPAPASV